MGLFDFFNKKKEEEKIFPQNEYSHFTCHFLYKEKPSADFDPIEKELSKHCKVKRISTDDMNGFLFLDHPFVLEENTLCPQGVFYLSNEKGIPKTTYACLTNFWKWEKAEETLNECNYFAIVTDMMSMATPYKERVTFFQKYLYSLIKETKPDAVYFLFCNKIIDPNEFLKNCETSGFDQLLDLINISIHRSDDNKIVVSSNGLNTLGLYDWQIKVKDYNEEIPKLVFAYCCYIFEHGNVIRDGDTIDGVVDGSKWICRIKESYPGSKHIVYSVDA